MAAALQQERRHQGGSLRPRGGFPARAHRSRRSSSCRSSLCPAKVAGENGERSLAALYDGAVELAGARLVEAAALHLDVAGEFPASRNGAPIGLRLAWLRALDL